MEANIIKLGNSKGIIIPAKLIKLIGLGERVNIDIKDSKIIIEPLEKEPRKEWDNLFSIARSKEDNELLIPDVLEEDIIEEWTW